MTTDSCNADPTACNAVNVMSLLEAGNTRLMLAEAGLAAAHAEMEAAKAAQRALVDIIQLQWAKHEQQGIEAAIRASLSTPFEGHFKAPSNAPQTREEAFAAHRRAHRMGVPGKIESDPELEAFIAENIVTLTFAEVAEAVAATFPPDRHTSTSAVHRWWQKRQRSEGKAI